jgi:hypothetical protein
MAEKKYKVIGNCPIMGADGKFTPPGDVVTLDPDDQTPGATNVQALIDGGHIEEAKSAPVRDDTGSKGK